MPFGKDDPKRQQKLLIAGIGGVALVVALVLLFVFRPWKKPAPPRLNEEPSKLANLVGSEDFKKMPFERREVYMKMMDTKKAQIVQAYANGQLSDTEYQKALEAAHLGKQLDEMRKYYVKPVGAARVAYLDKLVTKKETKDVAVKHNATAKQEKKEQDLFKDEAALQAEINSWPPEVIAQFEQFKSALSERKKIYKSAHPSKSATKPGAPATSPAD